MKKHLLLPLFSLASVLAAEPAPDFQGGIERLDPAIDQLLAPDAKIEVLASGFNWSEGPVWKDGQILFSDVPENTVFGWKEGDKNAFISLRPSGSLDGTGQGSNGLALDAQGNLILTQQGERRIARLEKDGSFTTLADQYNGKRFNSPNDLVIARSGQIFFTDPPYGMKKGVEQDAPYHGIYRVDTDGKVSLIIDDIRWPNGIALSPDEKILYLAISDKEAARVMAYDLQADGSVQNGRVIFNAQALKSAERKGSCDGMKVDTQGNIWTTGPGGVLILSPQGKHMGTILTGQNTGNCAWGGPEKDTMYITADMFLLRVKTRIQGY
ncbi:gluconolactonase [Prosthecobacter debontii]|uniref:Gluconolactonase n=1 Tax=Prosthecobacter debontii TaxID=48467 RepID=A0A1T4YHT0_9BACT|nr:SMP-30/gluconolactonase/LRE family protein [Prosthecobacter debontii]SKB00841.1 gluconolactonase [Prosthecobacter debontii]